MFRTESRCDCGAVSNDPLLGASEATHDDCGGTWRLHRIVGRIERLARGVQANLLTDLTLQSLPAHHTVPAGTDIAVDYTRTDKDGTIFLAQQDGDWAYHRTTDTLVFADMPLLEELEAHRERLARMVAKAPVSLVPCYNIEHSAMQLAEEIRAARKRGVNYRVRDRKARHAIATALASSGYDVDAFLRSI